MKNSKVFGSLLFLILLHTLAFADNKPEQAEAKKEAQKMKILVHVTQGPENPTRAALAFLVARTAIEEGHTVALFLAGDAVQLMRDAVLDNLTGLGTGKLREHYDAIVKGGGKFYLSGMSSKARGVTEAELKGKPAELAPPNVLLKLSLEHDRMFTY
jgi:predicted peroxiredoxin